MDLISSQISPFVQLVSSFIKIHVLNAFIAVASNVIDFDQKCFVRKSSAADHGQELVDDFLDHLHTLLKVIKLMRLIQF